MICKPLAVVAVALMLQACSGGRGDSAVPRPEAWPRLPLPEAAYRADSLLPLDFAYNAAAATITSADTTGGAVWATVNYPRLGAGIYVSFVPATGEETARLVAGRSRHMAEDLGPGMTPLGVETPSGPCTVWATEARVPTPMGAVAEAPGWVVSATLMLADSAYLVRPDSMAPARDYLMEDLWHAMSSLSPWTAK